MRIVNIAAYKFVTLDRLGERRRELQELSRRHGLRGTILLAPEGINMFVAGERSGIDQLLEHLRSQDEFADLTAKESVSARVPFRRMLVRLKREIIAFGIEGIDPREQPGRKLPPAELRRWLSEGRDFTLLDVRNDFEVDVGTFDGAQAIGVENFRDFPAAAEGLSEDMKAKPLVMFCTGGIRCEKAAPLMERMGFEDVLQLDGGILKYFEECGADHYHGDCFVFDQRVALDPRLAESSLGLCFQCQAVLSAEDQRSPTYVPHQSCPYCYQTVAERMDEQIAQRHEQILRLTTPLPGSVPYNNVRPVRVPQTHDHATLLDMLDSIRPYVGRSRWVEECAAGRVLYQAQPVAAERSVRAGETYQHVEPEVVEPPVSAEIEILWEDESIVVVNKPAPLPMHPCGRFNRNSLIWILNQVYAPEKVRVAHRLDANTSGVVVLSRRRAIASQLQPRFTAGEVDKLYVARAAGHPLEDEFTCRAGISNQVSRAGIRDIDESGLESETQFRVLQRLADGTSLLEVRPITGRTNQIRLHLWHLGMPVCGDTAYLPNRTLGDSQTLAPDDPPLCLHAWRIRFQHPASETPVEFSAPLPIWVTEIMGERADSDLQSDALSSPPGR